MDTPEIALKIFQPHAFVLPNILFVFGLFLILGVLGAIVAHRARWLPVITAFMLLGVFIGPSGISLITADILKESRVIIDVALGLILYKLGSDVQLRHMLRSTPVWRTALTEAAFTFICVLAAMIAFGYSMLVGALVAAIGVSSSPAVLVHVADEMQARGPIIHRAKALVTLNNVLAFFLFSLLLPFALGGHDLNWYSVLGIPLYRAFGAMAISLAIAFFMERIDRALNKEDQHYRFALIIGGITVTLGLSAMFEVSSLFAALMLGIFTRWFEPQRNGLSTIEFGSSADIFFIVLFVMAGANLHVKELMTVGAAALVVSIIRSLAKYSALLLNRGEPRRDHRETVALSFMLMPMAALAIGLAQTLQMLAPEAGSKVVTVIFAMVAILETAGPFAVNYAIRMTGESPFYRRGGAKAETPEGAAAEPETAVIPPAGSAGATDK
ncbi:MAG: peptidase [Alphaproteobacteria bacterium]|nr:peptidase [Alphaproteobacteria bacterium]